MLSVGCIEFDGPSAKEQSDDLSYEPGNLMRVCDRDFVVHDGAHSMALLYCATGNIQASGSTPPPQYPGYSRLVIAQHGRGSKAREYYETLTDVAASYRERTFVIAPQLLRLSEPVNHGGYAGVSGFTPGWHFQWGMNWPIGALSLKEGGPFTRSSFEMIDLLVEAAMQVLPDLREVVFVGQSAGGQLVNRYAAINQVHYPRNINVRYIPMNAQSYLYLDGSRPYPERALTGDIIGAPDPAEVNLAAICPDYNEYHVGLERLTWAYLVDRGITADMITSQFKSRKVINLVGALDTGDPDGEFVCKYAVQGKNRNERAKAYHAHVMEFYAPIAANHLVFEVAGAGHGYVKMLPSFCARRWIFDDAAAPCP